MALRWALAVAVARAKVGKRLTVMGSIFVLLKVEGVLGATLLRVGM